jgi:hypothetical protein
MPSPSLADLLRNSRYEAYLDCAPTGVQLPTLIATVHGVKRAMDIWIPREGWTSFERLVRELDLQYYVDTYFDRFSQAIQAVPKDRLTTTRASLSRTYDEGTEAHVFLARDADALDAVVGAGWYPLVVDGHIVEKHLLDHDKFGEALGYPQCCQTFFRERNNWLYDNTYYAAYQRTTTAPQSLSNGFLRHTAFGLTPHMACSFACDATMSYSGRLRSIIAEECPAYAREIDRQLATPILCLSELGIFRFEGTMISPNAVHYEEVEPIHPTDVSNDLFQALARGDTCELEANVLRIFKSGRFLMGYVARADQYGPQLPFLIQCA